MCIKRFFFRSSLACWCMCGALAWAQPTAPEAGASVRGDANQEMRSATPTKPDAPDTTTGTAASPGPAEDSSVFRPSEEISEDFAVSFPVDI